MPNLTTQAERATFRIDLESLSIDIGSFTAQAMNRIDELIAQGFSREEIIRALETDQEKVTGMFKQLTADIERQVDAGLGHQFQLRSNEPLAEANQLVKRVLDPAAEHCDTCIYLAGLPPMPIEEIEYPSMQLTHGETNCGPYCKCTIELVDQVTA